MLYYKTTGTGTGSVEIATELASIDFGMDAQATWVRGKDFFDAKKYPRAVFKGGLLSPFNRVPLLLVGELTLHRSIRDDCQQAAGLIAPSIEEAGWCASALERPS